MVVVASVIAAIGGSVWLLTHRSSESVTTRGVTETLLVPGHPGSVAAGRTALWLAQTGTQMPVRDRPLMRLDLASGKIKKTISVGGQASYLAHVGRRLFASVEHVGSSGSGPSLVTALNWQSGKLLARTQLQTQMGPLAADGADLWVLQVRPGALLRLDPQTLAPKARPLPLSRGRALGLAVGGGYIWATASDAGEVLRIDPATRKITPVRVGGFPVGIAVAGGSVWFVDRERAEVGRLAPRTLRLVGTPVRVGGAPEWQQFCVEHACASEHVLDHFCAASRDRKQWWDDWPELAGATTRRQSRRPHSARARCAGSCGRRRPGGRGERRLGDERRRGEADAHRPVTECRRRTDQSPS
jgi:DNA-binding beta-propeller fold protein YncE